MNLKILHLSDIHISNVSNLNTKLEKIFDAIKNNLLGENHLLVLTTGDIANKGKLEEFNIAEDFFSKLQTKITQYVPDICIYFIFSPGNHDADFDSENASTRDFIIDGLLQKKFEGLESISNELLKECFIQYSLFISKLNGTKKIESKNIASPFIRRYELKIENKTIAINSYNSAWMSRKTDDIGTFYFPFEKFNIKRKLPLADSSDITISMMHHPLNWYTPVWATQFKTFLQDTSHIIFTGHEHTSDIEIRNKYNQNARLFVSGGILHKEKKDISSFNMISIDLDSHSEKTCEFEWDNGEKRYIRTEHVSMNSLDSMTKKIYAFNAEYINNLTDPGMEISHDYKENIRLQDIFTRPNIKGIDLKKNALLDNQYSSDLLFQIQPDNDAYYFILGEEVSGKSTLLKMLQYTLHDKALIPIIIRGEQIKSADLSKIIDLIYKHFTYQYSGDELESFKESDKDKWMILLDDFHNIPLNSVFKKELLKNLGDNFSKVVITSSLDYEIELISSGEASSFFNKHQVYQIAEYGFKLRDSFISRWLKMGREHKYDELDNIGEKDNLSKVIDDTLGENLLPSYPFYILTLLQVNNPGQSSLNGSSYGHYYQYLITSALSKAKIQPEELDTYFSYLSFIAYRYFYTKRSEVDKQELLEWTRQFKEDYDEDMEFGTTLKSLISAKIILECNESYKFSYDYLRFFFIAKYLSDNITETEIIKYIEKMCERLHMAEYANIIMFLVHHTKNDILLEKIQQYSMKNFESFEVATLNKDNIENINNLIEKEIELLYEKKEILQERENRLDIKDKLAANNSNLKTITVPLDEPVGSLDIFAQINKTLKSIEIIGQILKTYTLHKGRKYALAEESFAAGMRALQSFFQFFEENKDILEGKLLEIEDKDPGISKNDQIKKLKNFIFQLSLLMTHGFIARTAKFVGSNKTLKTLDKVVDENDSSAYKLIRMAIDLDFPNGLKKDKVVELNKEFKGNYMTQVVLKALVLNHLYMFKVDHRTRQYILEKLEISADLESKIITTQKKLQ